MRRSARSATHCVSSRTGCNPRSIDQAPHSISPSREVVRLELDLGGRGHGVADETTLFKPFSRGTSGNDSPAGLGLGLALSLAQARAMGGDLVHEPRNGGGARFVLRLPGA